MNVMVMIASALQIAAYFFDPSLREKREKEKILAIFTDLEDKLGKALLEKDMYAVDKVRFWLKEMREKYDYLKEGK